MKIDPATFWDQQAAEPTQHIWLDDPQVRSYANSLIGGGEALWPLNWFQREYRRTFAKGLSIGCGTGGLERDLIRRGVCESMDAFDLSQESIVAARTAAEQEGFGNRIRYFVDDFERARLPKHAYDIVCFHQSLHHVGRLERLLREVRQTLKPGGLVYLDEFVGPSRTFWNDRTVAWYRALYELIPADTRDTRYSDTLNLPVEWHDWSEAVRSGEILSRLQVGFRIRHFRGYGGNLLSVMFPAMLKGRVTPDLVSSLIASEKTLLAAGAPHFYAIIVVEPKRGISGALSSVRYFIEPKLKRVAREMRLRLGWNYRPYAGEEEAFRL